MPKRCTYCGTENDELLDRCVQCGNELTAEPPQDEGVLPPVLARPLEARPLNGRFAFLVFFAYLGAQIATGMAAALIAFGFTAARGGPIHDADQRAEMLQTIVAFASLPIVLASGLVMLLLCLWRIRPFLRDTSPTGAAWVVGSSKQNAQGFGIGLLVAFGYFGLSLLFPAVEEEIQMGPLTRMAVTPGVQQMLWVSMALIFAPLIEECLFRGVLYGGFRNSFGPVWAAGLSSFLFWMLHLTEMIHYWPSMLAILAVACAALWCRLRFAAIGPAVAAHAGYNGLIALAAIFTTN